MRDMDKLAAQIKALKPSDRLRLAAELLDQGKTQLAYSIADTTVKELGARLALEIRT